MTCILLVSVLDASWHNAAGNSQMGGILQPNIGQFHCLGKFAVMHCNAVICLLLLESHQKI